MGFLFLARLNACLTFLQICSEDNIEMSPICGIGRPIPQEICFYIRSTREREKGDTIEIALMHNCEILLILNLTQRGAIRFCCVGQRPACRMHGTYCAQISHR